MDALSRCNMSRTLLSEMTARERSIGLRRSSEAILSGVEIGGQRRAILKLLSDRGPFDDDSIAKEIIGDQHASASDVEASIADLAADGLIEESDFAPGRWQITDEGAKALLTQ